MNLKLAFLLPGAIALCVSALPMLPVMSAPTDAPVVRTKQHANTLNLSDAQKADLKRIRESSHAQIRDVLNDDQRRQYDAMAQQRMNGQRPNGATGATGDRMQKGHRGLDSLNLTADQKTKVRSIMQASRQEMDKVFTPEQRQQMQQRRQQMQQRRQTAPAQPGV